MAVHPPRGAIEFDEFDYLKPPCSGINAETKEKHPDHGCDDTYANLYFDQQGYDMMYEEMHMYQVSSLCEMSRRHTRVADLPCSHAAPHTHSRAARGAAADTSFNGVG